MTHPALELRGVSVQYVIGRAGSRVAEERHRIDGKTVDALSDIDLALAPRSRTALIGSAGAGKSTLAQVAMGLLTPTVGRVYCGGDLVCAGGDASGRRREATLPPKALYRRIQMVAQDPGASLDPRKPIGMQLETPMRLLRGVPRRERAKEVTRLLYRLGLNPRRRDERPGAFSSPAQRRIAIACALAARPDVILLDAPLIGLDMRTRVRVLELLGELSEEFGIALVFITHDLRYVADIAERVVVLHAGRVVETFDPRVQAGGLHPHTQALFASVPSVGRMPDPVPLPAQRSALQRPEGCSYHPYCPKTQDVCRQTRPAIRSLAGGEVACHLVDETPEIVLLRRPVSVPRGA